jgi:hypothetical protein
MTEVEEQLKTIKARAEVKTPEFELVDFLTRRMGDAKMGYDSAMIRAKEIWDTEDYYDGGCCEDELNDLEYKLSHYQSEIILLNRIMKFTNKLWPVNQ